MPAYNPDDSRRSMCRNLANACGPFLSGPTIARLETASELGKPAVEGIEEQLLAEFREEVLADRVKQMVGHMVRQILEQRDWVLDQSDVKVQSVPFSKAARCRRADWFTFHAFRNSGDPRNIVITDRRQNPSLPSGARWTYYATFASPLKAAIAFGVRDMRQLRQQVHANGYQRVRVKRMLRRAGGAIDP